MADPFSIAVGALSLVQTCVSLTKIIAKTKNSLASAAGEADDAVKELTGLGSVCESVQDVCQKVRKDYESPTLSAPDMIRLKELCGRLAVSIEDCKEYVSQLHVLYVGIFGSVDTPASRRSSIKSAIKQLSKKDELREIHRKISTYRSNIQSQMIGLNSFYQFILIDHARQSVISMNTMNGSINTLQTSMQSIYSIIDQFLQPIAQSQFRPSLFSVRSIRLVDSGTRLDISRVTSGFQSVARNRSSWSRRPVDQGSSLSKDCSECPSLTPSPTIERILINASPQAEGLSVKSEVTIDMNRHFSLPHPPVDIFIGRVGLLADLVNVLNPLTIEQVPSQTSVVISGLGGIGKTQLAIKAAYTLRNLFFGVFWIDARSDQLARASWANIARDLGLEPNFQLTYDYLATLEMPWLVIVDLMDDPDIHMRSYIPSGDFGRIIITTRSPTAARLGVNVRKHYALNGFLHEESMQLLLAGMKHREPLSDSDIEAVSRIAETLSYHPMAINQAAEYFRISDESPEVFLKRFYSNRVTLQALNEDSQNPHSSNSTQDRQEISQDYQASIKHVLDKTMEMLEEDALQILKLISFFHNDNIPFEILFISSQRLLDKAPGADELVDDEKFASILPQPSLSIFHCLHSAVSQVLKSPRMQWLYQTPSILPKILLSSPDSRGPMARLQDALTSLQQHSLITLNDEKGMLWVHQLVSEHVKTLFHSTAEEAVTCEAALEILASCIDLEERTLTNVVQYVDSRFLLPHLIQVRQRSEDILQRYQMRQQSLGNLRSLVPHSWRSASISTRPNPLRLMKFSVIYFWSGEYRQARTLQEKAKSLLFRKWGTILNPQCVHASSALALTYHRLHLFDEAVELQRQTVQASETLYGKDHDITLSMTDILGLFFLSRGNLTESLRHSQQALSGLEKLHERDPQHRTTLTALNHLGAVHAQHYRWTESRQLCEMALKGLQRVDPGGEEIWLAKQNVAIAAIHLNDSNSHAEAETLMTEVYDHWKQALGDDHPSTLLAIFNRSRVLLCRGKIQEAEDLLLPALEVAKSRLGNEHFGFLSARMLLACIKLHQRRYAQAEAILVAVNDSYAELSYANDHVDRIATLWYLVECYKEQGRFDEALEVCEEMSDSMKMTMDFGLRVKHPLAKNLNFKRQELEGLKQSARIATMRMLEANVNVNSRIEGTVLETDGATTTCGSAGSLVTQRSAT